MARGEARGKGRGAVHMPAYLKELYISATSAVHILLVILGALVVSAVVQRFIKRLRRGFEAPHFIYHRAVLDAGEKPAQVAIWLWAASLVLKIVGRSPQAKPYIDIFMPVLTLAGIAVVTWFLIRLTTLMERAIRVRAEQMDKPLDPMATDALAKIIQAIIVIFAVMEVMRVFGLPLSSIVAVGGIGGVALGFASQGLVSNLVGGLTVYISQPFKVGEWVIMPEDNVQGQVKSIGWRSTVIMGFDRRPFYVPNSKFNTAVLINHSRMTNRRIQEYVHVRYQDIHLVPAIVEEAREFIGRHPGIDKEFFVVNFDSYGEFALRIFIYAFTATTSYAEYMQIKEEVLLGIADIIHRHGAQLAVPTSTIHVPEGIRLHGDYRPAVAGEPRAPEEPIL